MRFAARIHFRLHGINPKRDVTRFMRKLVVFLDLSESMDALRAAAPEFDVAIATDAQAAAGAEILVAPGAGAVELALASGSLRWVQAWGAGVERFPLEAMKRAGVALTNASGVHGQPIGESIFAMILAFARGVRTSVMHMAAHRWQAPDRLVEVHGQTLGILGMGAIGAETARMAKAMDMRVLGLRRTKGPVPHVDAIYAPDDLDAMLAECDIVVNILPLTPQTRGLMDAGRFAAMKPGAGYFSVGRGGTTDHGALIQALRAGAVGCAGLDVTDPEPLPAASPLWAMDNVLIMPHIAGRTQHYTARALEIFLENLRAYAQTGLPVRNVVDLDLGY